MDRASQTGQHAAHGTLRESLCAAWLATVLREPPPRQCLTQVVGTPLELASSTPQSELARQQGEALELKLCSTTQTGLSQPVTRVRCEAEGRAG